MAEVIIDNKKITICSQNIPPDLPNDIVREYFPRLINSLVAPFIICTDTNARHPLWGSHSSDARGNILSELVEEYSLVVLNNDEPTFISHNGKFSHIDLTISSADIAPLFQWQPYQDTCNSDHFPISINSSIPIHNSPPFLAGS